MLRAAEIGLTAAVAAAVLAFGGTEPMVFAAAQALLLALAAALLLREACEKASGTRWPVGFTAALLLWVLARLLPFDWARSSDWRATLEHALLLAACVAAFFVVRRLADDPARRNRIVLAFLLLGLFEAFYGLAQYLTHSQTVFGYSKPFGAEDASGTYVNRNHFAGFLGMVMPFALGLGFAPLHARRAAPNSMARHRAAFWLLVATLMFVAVVFSKSRMGILACLVAAGVTSSLQLLASPRQRRVFAPILALAAASLLLALWIGIEPVAARFGILDQEFAAPGRGRLEIWRDTSQLIAARPWMGAGLGAFPAAYTSVQTAFLDRFVHHAHNDYLQLAAELGVPAATIVFGTMLAVLLRCAWFARSPSSPSGQAVALGASGGLAALLTHSLTDFNLYVPANALTLSCVLALGCSTFPERAGGIK